MVDLWILLEVFSTIFTLFTFSFFFFQFRPAVPAPQSQQYVPVASQHFPPAGQGVSVMNAGLPSQNMQPQFPQLMHQLPARPGQPAPSHGPPPPQVVPLPNAQQSNHIASGSSLPQANVQAPTNYASGLGGLARPFSASYTVRPFISLVIFNYSGLL